MIKDKAVRLTSIQTSYPQKEEGGRSPHLSFNDLQNISPVMMLEHAFTAKYGNPLPEEIRILFEEVVQEVNG